MKVLCTCCPGHGHFHPMLPVAIALTGAGHEVRFSSAAEFCPIIEKHGFGTIAAGLGQASATAETVRRHPQLETMRGDPRARALLVPALFAGVRLEYTLSTLVPAAVDFGPDVVVHDMMEFNGPIVADALNVPHASVSYGPVMPPDLIASAAAAMAPHRHRY